MSFLHQALDVDEAGQLQVDVLTMPTTTVTISGATAIGTFIRNVTTAGTAVQITSTSTPCQEVVLNARLGNTNTVVIGDVNVIAADATQRGIVLIPGNDPVRIKISNLNLLYVDSQTDGDGVCGAYFT